MPNPDFESLNNIGVCIPAFTHVVIIGVGNLPGGLLLYIRGTKHDSRAVRGRNEHEQLGTCVSCCKSMEDWNDYAPMHCAESAETTEYR